MSVKPQPDPGIHQRRSIRLKDYDYSQAGAYFITLCTYHRASLFGAIANGEMRLNELGEIAQAQWYQLPRRYGNIELGQFIVMPNHVHGILFFTDHSPAGDESTPTRLGQAGFTSNDDESARSGAGRPQGPLPGNDTPQSPVAAGLAPAGNESTPTRPEQAGVISNDDESARSGPGRPQGSPLLGTVIGAYKSLVVNECLKIHKTRNEFMGKLWQRNYWEHILRDEQSYRKVAAYIANNPALWEIDQFFIKT